MARISKSGAVNKYFVERIKPTMEGWGLSQHPNPASYFGKSEHGYCYDFADLRNEDEVKLAAFGILNPGPQLWIKGLRIRGKFKNFADIPIIFDNIDGVFTLTRSWSIFRPLNIRFEFDKKNKESNEEAAARLIDGAAKDLHKLREHLYG